MLTSAMARFRCTSMTEADAILVLQKDDRPWVRKTALVFPERILLGEVRAVKGPDGEWSSRRVMVQKPNGDLPLFGLIPTEEGWRTVLVQA